MGEADFRTNVEHIKIPTAGANENIGLKWLALKCPNPDCSKFTLDVGAGFGNTYVNGAGTVRFKGKFEGMIPDDPVGIGSFRFSPRVGLPLSVHVPAAAKEDYEEACMIKDLSPKAAATLCRRALQGMARDYWGVKENSLHDELKKIEPSCDPDLFRALMGIKSVGNIGAHPEKDINLIIDVEEGEVEALISVLQILDAEWYVARAGRSARLAAVHSLSAMKAAAKNVSAGAAPAPRSGS